MSDKIVLNRHFIAYLIKVDLGLVNREAGAFWTLSRRERNSRQNYQQGDEHVGTIITIF